jgi:hypothetical protein
VLIDDLLTNAGFYVGSGASPRLQWVARLVLTPLPGAAGVAVDFEALSSEGRVLRKEHSILAEAADGPTILVVATYRGDNKVLVLREIEPGFFAEAQSGTYRKGQMAVRVGVPQAGAIRYAYCYAEENGTFEEVDVADLTLVT